MADTPQSQTTEETARVGNAPLQAGRKGHTEVCSHIGARDYDDWSDYYEGLVDVLGHILAVFHGLRVLAEDAHEEDMANLSYLGQDLAQEAIRRAERMHEEV
jgi:hypothetical protein